MKIFFTITFIILFTFSTIRLAVNARDNSISNEIDMGSTTPINQIANFYLNGTNPVELGKVNWLRNFDEAVKRAKKLNKTILVLFQEVPGCSTSSGYGREVLSHPLIVDAIQSLFVPVAIYNNHGGDDYKTLRSFGEPSWNNPVVRIITPERNELAPRLSGDYSQLKLVNRILRALKESNETAPPYLELLAQELRAKSSNIEEATFAMHCFWEGEAKLGNIEGVISTKPGFMNGHEVVEILYDPEVTSYAELISKANAEKVANHVFVKDNKQKDVVEKITAGSSISEKSTFRADDDPKHYLAHTFLKYVPMTQLQSARVNAAIAQGKSPEQLLSPSQLQLLEFIKKHPDLNWPNAVDSSDYVTAWNSSMTIVSNYYK